MKLKEKNAISLIVLVITILVLSILAATVIISLSNTNIISQANDAVKKTEAQQIEEAKTLMYADGMLGYNPEDIVIGNTTLSWDDTSKSVQTKVDTVKIPDGFYYVGGTKETGLVISDNSADANMGVDYTCVGNQFVWIPVEYIATGVNDENGLDTGFTAVFHTGLPEETSEGSGVYKMTSQDEYGNVSYRVPFTDDYDMSCSFKEPGGWIDELDYSSEYYAMCRSVEKYNGFYIARFEAGDGDATEERTESTEVRTVVSKKGAIVYNYVGWSLCDTESYVTSFSDDCAVGLSRDMYKDSTSVVSTLCYGVQWDATMNFVSDKEHNIVDSSSWGNFESKQLTGASESWKAKNIYDLAGNFSEFTMELVDDCTEYNMWLASMDHPYGRGASSAAGREHYYNDAYIYDSASEDIGFRVTLYIK